MEAYVSCCIGALAAGSAYGLSGLHDGAGLSMSRVWPGGPPHAMAWAAMRSMGAAVIASGVVGSGIARAVRDEVRGLDCCGRRALAHVDEAEAFALLIATSVGAGCICAVVMAAPAGLAVGAALPSAIVGARHAARVRAERIRVEREMPEVFGALAVSLGSGLSLGQAMRYVGGHAKEPVRSELLRVACEMACGAPVAQALRDLMGRLHAPGLELVALALSVSQRTGAPLAGLLADASKLTGERIELMRRLDVKTSQARMSAHVVAGMPVAMLVLLSLFSSDFRAGLVTVTGMVSVAVALALNALAWIIIGRVMNVRL